MAASFEPSTYFPQSLGFHPEFGCNHPKGKLRETEP